MSDSILAMSDDDFLNATPPEVAQEVPQETTPEAAPVVLEDTPSAPVAAPEASPVEAPAEPVVEPKEEINPLASPDDEVSKPLAKPQGEAEPKPDAKPVEDEAPAGEAKPEGEKPDGAEQTDEDKAAAVVAAETPVDYKSEYEKILAPFTANGRQIQVKDADEALRLMQMGANYTRKMQDIAPHRSVLRMLESNGLLDGSKLSFLIDLDKKDPAAIRQLIKDSGIDPLEIDPTAETGYTPGAHQISEGEEAFRTVLDEVSSSQNGREFLQSIHTQWDTTSKQALAEEPEILTALSQQRENGIYTIITNEIDRQKTFGKIPATMPFLQAYKTVGDQVAAAGGFNHLKPTEAAPVEPAKPEPVVPAAKVPVATTVAQPKPDVSADDAVAAAAPGKTTNTPAKTIVNPLAMSDDEFMALNAHRV